jgi:hypothetical protein
MNLEELLNKEKLPNKENRDHKEDILRFEKFKEKADDYILKVAEEFGEVAAKNEIAPAKFYESHAFSYLLARPLEEKMIKSKIINYLKKPFAFIRV